jgi:hypothetical protein
MFNTMKLSLNIVFSHFLPKIMYMLMFAIGIYYAHPHQLITIQLCIFQKGNYERMK